MAETLFRPSHDGDVEYSTFPDASGISWADLWGKLTGNGLSQGASAVRGPHMTASLSNEDHWYRLIRSFAMFDTSSLGEDCNIIRVKLELYGSAASKDTLGNNPRLMVFNATTQEVDTLVLGDFDQVGITPFSDTPIYWNDWEQSDWNEFVFNADGIAAINKTGITKMGFRFWDYDHIYEEPPWSENGAAYATAFLWADKLWPIAVQRPKLTVEYALALYPSDEVARVSAIHRVFRPGLYRMEVALGDLGFDVDVAEAAVKKVVGEVEEPTEPSEEPGAPYEVPFTPDIAPYVPAWIQWMMAQGIKPPKAKGKITPEEAEKYKGAWMKWMEDIGKKPTGGGGAGQDIPYEPM